MYILLFYAEKAYICKIKIVIMKTTRMGFFEVAMTKYMLCVRLRKIVFIPFFVCMFIACNQENGTIPLPPTDTIDVFPCQSIDFTDKAESDTLIVHSSGEWTIGVLMDWISVSPQSGVNGDTLFVSVTENISTDERRHQLMLFCGKAQVNVNVYQKGADDVLNPDTISGKIVDDGEVIITDDTPHTFVMEDNVPGNWDAYVLFANDAGIQYWQKYLSIMDTPQFTVYAEGELLAWNKAVAIKDTVNGNIYNPGMVVCRKDTSYFYFNVLPTQPIIEKVAFTYDSFDYEFGEFVNPKCYVEMTMKRSGQIYYYVDNGSWLVDTDYINPTEIGENKYAYTFDGSENYWSWMSYIWMKSFNDYGSSEATELNIINYVDNPKVLEYVNELVNSSSSLD